MSSRLNTAPVGFPGEITQIARGWILFATDSL